MRTLLFKSKNNPDQAISISDNQHGLYFLTAMADTVPEEEMVYFTSIEEIEEFLDDNLELIILKQ